MWVLELGRGRCRHRWQGRPEEREQRQPSSKTSHSDFESCDLVLAWPNQEATSELLLGVNLYNQRALWKVFPLHQNPWQVALASTSSCLEGCKEIPLMALLRWLLHRPAQPLLYFVAFKQLFCPGSRGRLVKGKFPFLLLKLRKFENAPTCLYVGDRLGHPEFQNPK